MTTWQRGVLSLIGTLVLCGPAAAIPAFARRYKVDCVFCHDGFPKLNSAGQKFKDRGFRMENEDRFDFGKWVRSGPAIVRGSLNHSFVEGQGGATVGTVKAVSAASLGPHVSYWVDDAIAIADGDTTHLKPDNAWVRIDVRDAGRLYARGGRMELDLPFTQTRTPHLFSYDAYFANAGIETDSIAQHKEGVEIGGNLPSETHWSAALVKGHETADTSGFNPAVFLRLSQWLGRNRVGAFAYVAKSTQSLEANAWDDRLLRLGADANVRVGRLNLYGLYMHGRNSRPTSPAATPLTFDSGFAQADYHLLSWIEPSARVNVVREPLGTGPPVTFVSLFPGLQVFILEHGKVSFEYGLQNQSRARIGAVQAEIAF